VLRSNALVERRLEIRDLIEQALHLARQRRVPCRCKCRRVCRLGLHLGQCLRRRPPPPPPPRLLGMGEAHVTVSEQLTPPLYSTAGVEPGGLAGGAPHRTLQRLKRGAVHRTLQQHPVP